MGYLLINATSITCRYANHGPKSTSENEQVCLHEEKAHIENISISDFFFFFFKKKEKKRKEIKLEKVKK